MPQCKLNAASEDYADFIIQYSALSFESLAQLTDNQCLHFVNREYVVVSAELDLVSPISVARHTYTAIPKLYGLLDTTALESSGILQAFEQPSIRANGRGVILGIIDTGIDYTNPLFQLSDGTSRILSLWDQSIQSAEPPEIVGEFEPFYGTVYDNAQITQALRSEDPLQLVPSQDTDGHGTFLAGVAAGKRISAPTSFSGAAPEATLAIVKLRPAKQYLRDFYLIPPGVPAYQENDIMMAVSFLLALANREQLPIVLLLGSGTNQGSHDGTSPLSLQLQSLIVRKGVVVVVSAGNEVGYQHHYLGTLSEKQEFEDVELRVAPGDAGFCMEIWARTPELYTIGFISPAGEVIQPVPLVLGNETLIPFRLDNTRITLTYQSYEANSASQLAFLRFETPSPGIWHIRVYPVLPLAGLFHIWLPQHEFVSEQTLFLRPDPDVTITDPGNASMPITVSAYQHRNESLYIHSSRGFTRSGQIKPDIAAPGVEVQGPGLNAGTSANTLTFVRRSGTSVSAAITAGAAAGILSWGITDGNNPDLNSATVKAMLIRGADRNPAFRYPNREWGFGTLNLYQSFLTPSSG
ncbi:MAG: S8 family peptidase [Lachnospiraceae bacterium]|nr:S8 family peptidase [Lachnospiraceae bacterium]